MSTLTFSEKAFERVVQKVNSDFSSEQYCGIFVFKSVQKSLILDHEQLETRTARVGPKTLIFVRNFRKLNLGLS